MTHPFSCAPRADPPLATSRRVSGLLERTLEQVSESELLKTHRARLLEMRERLHEGRFHLAVLGQFKRGKSTLLNALVGAKVLPSTVIPTTATPTFVKAGSELRARVELFSGGSPEVLEGRDDEAVSEFLSKFVTEEANPENRLGVSKVELFHPAPILRDGVVFIDTPGIGSTHHHNTVSTLQLLPQCDAALFVLSADPPITQVELDFLKRIREKVARLFFVLNKIDYLSQEDRTEAVQFFKRVLREDVGIQEEVSIFEVSARQGLQAKLTEDLDLWAESGLPELESLLIDFLATEKNRTLEQAVAQRARDVVCDALLQSRLSIRSLQMPIEELDQRRSMLLSKIDDARQQRVVATDLLAGDERRLQQFLEERAEALRQNARDHLRAVLEDALEETREGKGPDHPSIETALAAAVVPFFERELTESTRPLEDRFRKILASHEARLDELVSSVQSAAAELFEVPYQAGGQAQALELNREPPWITREWSTSLSPVSEGRLDGLLPQGVRRRRLQRRFDEKVDALVVQNVENLRWMLLQELRRNFRRFLRRHEERLERTVTATLGAVENAQIQRKERSRTVSREIADLRSLIDRLETLESELGDCIDVTPP